VALTVRTPHEAARVLDYFNHFHDGFVRRLALASHDHFPTRSEQACSGHLDLEVTFAHHNYRDGAPPAGQEIRARFLRVRSLRAELSGRAIEWSIQRVDIGPGTRPLDTGSEEPCLVLTLVQSRLEGGTRWVHHEDLGFSFEHATFEEVLPP
jgi:hypothetical protein